MSNQEKLKKLAQANFKKWSNALVSGDVEKISHLYAENNTFHPTMLGELKKGISGCKEYFYHFLEKNPQCRVCQEEVVPIDKNCYLHTGMYNFSLKKKGEEELVKARFTFIWQKKDNSWKIIHHHSSVLPKV